MRTDFTPGDYVIYGHLAKDRAYGTYIKCGVARDSVTGKVTTGGYFKPRNLTAWVAPQYAASHHIQAGVEYKIIVHRSALHTCRIREAIEVGSNAAAQREKREMENVAALQQAAQNTAARNTRINNETFGEKVWLNVPFEEHEEAKSMGCRWDPEVSRFLHIAGSRFTSRGLWYCTTDNATAIARWGITKAERTEERVETPGASVPTNKTNADTLREVRDAIRHAINGSKLRRNFSSRRLIQWAAMLNAGFAIHEIASEYFAGWSEQDRKAAATTTPALAKFLAPYTSTESFSQRLVRYAQVKDMHGYHLNIGCVGPAGSGKTTMGDFLSKQLGRPLYTDSFTRDTPPWTLSGQYKPLGQDVWKYITPEFVKAYETGGVYVADEFDAADANAILVLNRALANGTMSVPERHEQPMAVRHPDFIFVAMMNTFGQGGSRMWAGRETLDEATLDRIVMMTVDYDPVFEDTVLDTLTA